jgi:hypothetical protein
MDKNQFQELLWMGMGRAITYARENNVQQFRDVILDACLHCRAVDPISEGTRADYMFGLVNLLPNRQFYCDEVLNALPGSGDDRDAEQRFRFAACMAFKRDERAKQIMYESFEPGPRWGEGIGINFVQMDGRKGLVFAAAKIGELMISKSLEVETGWLWSSALEICGEKKAELALRRAAAEDPRVEAYRLSVVKGRSGKDTWEEIKALGYEQLKPRLAGLRGFRLTGWGRRASDEDVEQAARGLLASQTPTEQLQHLRIFADRSFPLEPSSVVEITLSGQKDLAHAGAVALAQISHPSVRDLAFRLAETRGPGWDHAIGMLDRNWQPGDHEVALGWFESEHDHDVRHRMQMDLRQFWEHHPEPPTEVRMLLSLYEHGPCSFCRRYVIERLIDLHSLPAPVRAECAYDANEDVRDLAAMESP